jgi:hypothetical protein
MLLPKLGLLPQTSQWAATVAPRGHGSLGSIGGVMRWVARPSVLERPVTGPIRRPNRYCDPRTLPDASGAQGVRGPD